MTESENPDKLVIRREHGPKCGNFLFPFARGTSISSGGIILKPLRLVFVFFLLAFILSQFPAAAERTNQRTQTERYAVGLDGAVSCETNIGGACFELMGDERLAAIKISDDSHKAVSGIYEVKDASGATLSLVPFCDSVNFEVADRASQINVYIGGPAFGILSCQFAGGSLGAGTVGSITVTYALKGEGRQSFSFDEERECLEPAPAAFDVGGVTDDGSKVSLDVVVLLDKVSLTRGQGIFAKAAESYSPLKIDLRPEFKEVSFKGTEIHGMLAQAKDLFKGQRPQGTDVVYVLTSKDLTLLGLPVAGGLADCIGGVRFPERAFAVGIDKDFTTEFGPFTFDTNIPAKVAAHEIGHLMGGQHHYANCVEGIPSELLEEREVSPCTLMFNAADFVSHNFSSTNALIVRGHAVQFANSE